MQLSLKENQKTSKFRPSKILVIEDDRETAEVVQMFFSMNGYQCHVEDGTVDIGLSIERCNPDLILVDFLLPRINGGELCSMIKKTPRWSHLPVIIYSAYPKVWKSLGDYRCDAFVAKPFDLAHLLLVVSSCLTGNRA